MAQIIVNGIPVKYTCKNSKFETDITEGYAPKSRNGVKGSVTKKPFYENDYSSFWLEHVIEIKTGKKLFWFMWYKTNGEPMMPMSSVFDKDDLLTVIKNIAEIKF